MDTKKPAPAKKAAAKKAAKKKLTDKQLNKAVGLAVKGAFSDVPKLKPATQTATPSSDISVDWEAIERDFRAGVLSIREIAKLNDVSEGAVRKRPRPRGGSATLLLG